MYLILKRAQAHTTEIEPLWSDDSAFVTASQHQSQPERHFRSLHWFEGTILSLHLTFPVYSYADHHQFVHPRAGDDFNKLILCLVFKTPLSPLQRIPDLRDGVCLNFGSSLLQKYFLDGVQQFKIYQLILSMK